MATVYWVGAVPASSLTPCVLVQTVTALREAEEYPGAALILAFSPCVDWGGEQVKAPATTTLSDRQAETDRGMHRYMDTDRDTDRGR